MALQEQPGQPQQPDFVLVGGSVSQPSPSAKEMFAQISQRLDEIAKYLGDSSDTTRECLDKGGESTIKGLGKSVDGTGNVSDDIAKRLPKIEDDLASYHGHYIDLENRFEDAYTDNEYYHSSTDKRIRDLEERMSKMAARQLASETNAIARMLNNRPLKSTDKLEPLVSIANERMYDFPYSLEALDALPLETVNRLLERLGQPAEASSANARRRLAHLAGCFIVQV